MNKTFPPLPPFWPELRFYNELDSSNAELRRLDEMHDARHGSAVITQYQKAGRGQQGNQWQGNEGENLYLSLFLKPEINPQEQFFFNMKISLLIAEVLKIFAPETKIKWPNDFVLNNKKIGGILIENSLSGNKISRTIIGIGINCNQIAFSNLPHASSLKLELGQSIQIDTLRDKILEHLALQLCKESLREDIIKDYHQSLWKYQTNTTFESEGNAFEAKVEGCDEYGRLVLSGDNGIQYFNVKEIKWTSW